VRYSLSSTGRTSRMIARIFFDTPPCIVDLRHHSVDRPPSAVRRSRPRAA
jgi:hypothetical protein